MRRGALALLVVASVIPVLLPAASAQLPINPIRSSLAFDVVSDTTFIPVSQGILGRGQGGQILNSYAEFRFDVVDRSYDPQSAGGTPIYHRITYEAKFVDPSVLNDGWLLLSVPIDTSSSRTGDRNPQTLRIDHLPTTNTSMATVQVRVTMDIPQQPEASSFSRDFNFTARIMPSPALTLQLDFQNPKLRLNAGPNEDVVVPVILFNPDLYVQKYNVQLKIDAGQGVDPDKIPRIGEGGYTLMPKEERTLYLGFRTPKEQTWYRSTTMTYTVTASSGSDPSIFQPVSNVITIDGFYFGQAIVLVIPLLILLLILILLAIIRSKRYYEERILGKPIPPWRIPEEKTALTDLRRRDQRAFYDTRYFLMEEEYASALAWFGVFKKREKRQLKAESSAARFASKAEALEDPSSHRFERRAERIKRKIKHKQERRRLKLEAELQALQDKVDQHFEEDYEKDHEKWEKKVEKLTKKANKPWYRAHRKWEAETEKILEKWEKPFLKEKAQKDKAISKTKEAHAKIVKKKDKQAWKDWREAIELAEAENKVRKKEGLDPLPLPDPVSKVVGPPELPPAFRPPPKPRLPPEPQAPVVKGLPAEPQLVKPRLKDSHYAKKAARRERKTDRKIRRLDKKQVRLLARNERKRLRWLARQERTRGKYLKRAVVASTPGLFAKMVGLTPERRERRAQRKLLRALSEEKIRSFVDSERSRIEVLATHQEREEAELVARLARARAEARKTGAPIDDEADAQQLAELREKQQAKLIEEQAASERRIDEARARAHRDLQDQVAKNLVEERAGTPPTASVSKKTPAKSPK